MERAFPFVRIPERDEKPRSRGLTMVIDWGLGLDAQRDLCRLAGDYLDLGKIAVGISGLLSPATVSAKIAAYEEARVAAFPGGMFLELAYAQGVWREYFEEARKLGYRVVEVSDNAVRFDRATRSKLIRAAAEEFGFQVLGEVGSKHAVTPVATLVDDIRDALEAGAWKVFVEAAEFSRRGGAEDLLERLMAAVPVDALIFELPGRWIPDVHTHEIHALCVRLIAQIGPHVNIGNVPHGDVLLVETLRRGVGVTMGHAGPPGAWPTGHASS